MSGKRVPHSIANIAPTSRRLLSKKLPSREITESNSCSGCSFGKRKTNRAMLNTITMQRNARKYAPIAEYANEWTELMIPLRTSKVPNMERAKEAITRLRFQTLSIPLRSCTIAECRNAVAVNHGSSAAFSTGSQPQYPPHPRTWYAHHAPNTSPNVWIDH